MADVTPLITHPALTTDDGIELAADLASVEEPRGLAVLAHPHPNFGGNRHVHMIEAWFRALPIAALPGIEELPLLAAGWSFGSEILLAHPAPEIAAWVAVAPPASQRSTETPAGADQRPTLILAPEHDQFAPPDVACAATDGWIATEIEAIPGTDHSLMGATDRIVARTLEAFDSLGSELTNNDPGTD